MDQTQLINVYRSALMDNLLKIQQECVCTIAQVDHLLITTWKSVLQYAQQLQIYMVKQFSTHAFKDVLQLLIGMLTIQQGSVCQIVHLISRHLQID